MHIPVLLKETIDALNLKEGSVVVDATLGNGGHAEQALKLIGPKGIFIGFDVDQLAIEKFQISHQESGAKKYLINDNFANLEKVLTDLKIEKVDAIMADLGWRAEQIEDPGYGLSFLQEGPLDMRLNKIKNQTVNSKKEDKTDKINETELTAYEIVNGCPEEKLAEIFRKYGEEKYARLAARFIGMQRKRQRITTTTQLAALIENILGAKYKKEARRRMKKNFGGRGIHPATRIFQALRIVVNRELETLEAFLPQALERLESGGRLAVITFHSLEDRIVKHFFKANTGGCVCPKEIPVCVCGQKPKLKIITKKPIVAGPEELESNPRSRSAKLRVIEKI